MLVGPSRVDARYPASHRQCKCIACTAGGTHPDWYLLGWYLLGLHLLLGSGHHSKGQVGAVISLFNHSKGQVGAVIDLFRGDLCCPGKIGAHLGRTNNQGTTSLRPKGAAGMHATVDKPLLHRSVLIQTTPTQELWQHSYTGALTPETTANPVPSEFCTEKNQQ